MDTGLDRSSVNTGLDRSSVDTGLDRSSVDTGLDEVLWKVRNAVGVHTCDSICKQVTAMDTIIIT